MIKKDKITQKISFLSCVIDFEKKKILQIILDNGDPENSHYCEYFHQIPSFQRIYLIKTNYLSLLKKNPLIIGLIFNIIRSNYFKRF